MHVSVALKVNGKAVSAKVEARTLLVQLLRENLRLTGTHVGCDTSQCGACVVHVDGKAIKSCTILAAQCDSADVVTIEGLAKDGKLHPMQQAFMDNHGLQCGFCTPGMVMASVDIVRRHPNGLDEKTVRRELEGNICRCTGYHNIVKAVLDAAPKMKGM
jgi:carbon-monoxide dehydrogenase small subunit